MKILNKWVLAVVGIVIGVAVGYLVFKQSTPTLAGAVGVKLAENYDPYIKYNGGYNSNLPIQTAGGMSVTGGTTIGSTGTLINNETWGNCYIKAYATTIAASTTAAVDCQANAAVSANGIAPLPGVGTNDSVQVELSTTTANQPFGGLDLLGASASSTTGYITLLLVNSTGATYTWPVTGTATGTASYESYR